jgi:maleate cis-trans isomerase
VGSAAPARLIESRRTAARLEVLAVFGSFVPRRKIGYLSPLPVIDNGPYEFYHLVPHQRGIVLTMTPVGLREFSSTDLDRVLAPVDELLVALGERGIDLVVLAGVPVGLIAGPVKLRRVLAHMEQRAGVPATSTVLDVVDAAKALGLRRVAVANKWSETMNRTLADFFAAEGIEMVGVAARSMQPAEFQKMTSANGIELAYELGRRALREHPEADGCYIGGGAWITQPVVEHLEAEFGRPVINNQVSGIWHWLHMLGVWEPIRGHGRLLEGS